MAPLFDYSQLTTSRDIHSTCVLTKCKMYPSLLEAIRDTCWHNRGNRWTSIQLLIVFYVCECEAFGLYLPPATKLGQGNIFRSVCPHSVRSGGMHGCSGGCMVARGAYVVAPGGCMVALEGGMHGCPGGACMVALGGHVWLLRGHAWLLPGGACMVATRGHAWLSGGHVWLLPGVCMVAPGGVWLLRGGMHGIWWETEIRSMSGRYASYWNAFLFRIRISSTLQHYRFVLMFARFTSRDFDSSINNCF